MNSAVAPHLALILFLPWYAVLLWLFWRMRASGRGGQRKLVVGVFIALALVAAGVAGVWSYHYADTSVGTIWKQILASSVGYGAFLLVLLTGYMALRAPGASSRRSGRAEVDPGRDHA